MVKKIQENIIMMQDGAFFALFLLVSRFKSTLSFVSQYRGSEGWHDSCRFVFVPVLNEIICPEVEDHVS